MVCELSAYQDIYHDANLSYWWVSLAIDWCDVDKRSLPWFSLSLLRINSGIWRFNERFEYMSNWTKWMIRFLHGWICNRVIQYLLLVLMWYIYMLHPYSITFSYIFVLCIYACVCVSAFVLECMCQGCILAVNTSFRTERIFQLSNTLMMQYFW